jgi:glucose dehydrogenase
MWNEDENIIEMSLKSPQIWIEPPTYGQEVTGFEIDRIQVITKVDLAFLNSEEQFIIFDWKTSVPVNQTTYWITQPGFQAAVYQLWANLSFKIALSNINAHFIYFGSTHPKKLSFTIDENMKEYTLSLIRRSTSRMKYFHQQIHHDNLQLTLDRILRLTLDDLDFAYTEKSCIYCPFKRICRRELEARIVVQKC